MRGLTKSIAIVDSCSPLSIPIIHEERLMSVAGSSINDIN